MSTGTAAEGTERPQFAEIDAKVFGQQHSGEPCRWSGGLWISLLTGRGIQERHVTAVRPLRLVPVEAGTVGGTAVEPVDEVVCPACGAHIRARMSDAQPAAPVAAPSDRRAALEDFEHILTLALHAMAEIDCCAAEDDPDWRGSAVEQFRKDLRALGVTDFELDLVGIRLPTAPSGEAQR